MPDAPTPTKRLAEIRAMLDAPWYDDDPGSQFGPQREALRFLLGEVERMRAEIETFKAANRYQRGFHDGQNSERNRILGAVLPTREDR